MFVLFSFNFVDYFEHITEEHMDKGDDHGEFHFEGVFEVKSVFRNAPWSLDDAEICGSEDFHAKEFVVDDSTVDAHEGHHVEHGSDLQVKADGEHHESVADVAEHHAEENGDGGEHEDGGKNLIVLGD